MIPHADEIEALWQQTRRSIRAYHAARWLEQGQQEPAKAESPQLTGMPAGDPRHGKRSGYATHRKYGEKACDACNEANNAYYRQRRDQRKSA